MHLTSLAILSGAAAFVSAAALTPRDRSPPYTLLAQSTDQKIDGGIISASKNKMWVSLPESIKDAECGQGPNETLEYGVATVFLDSYRDQLFLYHDQDSSQSLLSTARQVVCFPVLRFFFSHFCFNNKQIRCSCRLTTI